MGHPVALTFKDQEMAMVDQAVNHGDSHLFIGKNASPFRKFKICCQNETFTFGAVSNNPKQQLRPFFIDGYIAPFVQDE